MGKKKLTLEELRGGRADIDQAILQVRKLLETHKIEREKLYSAENRRRLSPQGLKEDEDKLRRKTEQALSALNATIREKAHGMGEHRDAWTYEHELRNGRFSRAYEGIPGTVEAQQKALNGELLETLKRLSAENRAHRYTVADLITETERAALEGDVATLSVFRQAARDRDLKGVDKVNFDTAFRKLTLPEIDEAQALYKDLEDLSQEADGLFTLWKEPQNQMAQSYESLGRFNRKKRAEAFVKMIEEAKVSEAEAARLQWQHGQPQAPQEQQADAPEPPLAA